MSVGSNHDRPRDRFKNLSMRAAVGREGFELLATSGHLLTCDDLQRSSYDGISTSNERTCNVLPASKSKRSANLKEIEKLILLTPCRPLIAWKTTRSYLEKYIYMYKPQDIDTVMNIIGLKMQNWTIPEFISFYQNPNVKPRFRAHYNEVDHEYLDVEESINVCQQFLKFQFNDEENIRDFLCYLYKILDRQIPKLNTLMVVAPATSGKNWFFESVLDYFILVGNMHNPNRYETFAYMETVNKRVILWNEPNYASTETDTLKMLLGGDGLAVKVKYQLDQYVRRTPVIILSNVTPAFMSEQPFQDRVKSFSWSRCPMLKHITKNPNPFVFIELCKLYNVIQ